MERPLIVSVILVLFAGLSIGVGCAPTTVATIEQTAMAHCDSEGLQFRFDSSSTGPATESISGQCLSSREGGVRSAISGQEQEVWFYLAANRDCSSRGVPLAVVKRPASHGVVRITNDDAVPVYGAYNPQQTCGSKMIPAIFVLYTSRNGYSGPDEFDIATTFPGGEVQSNTVKINVIPVSGR